MPDSGPSSREAPRRSVLRRLFALGLQYRTDCLRVFSFQVVLLVLGLLGLGLSGTAIDLVRAAVQPGAPAPRFPLDYQPPAELGARELLLALGGSILAMAALRSLIAYAYAVAVGRLLHLKFVPELRTRVFDKLQRLSFRFFDEHASGSIINRVTGDVQAVRSFVDGVVLQGAIMVLSLGVYLVYMLRTHVLLTVLCLSLTPLLWLFTQWFSRWARPAYAQNRELLDRLVLAMTEGIKGVLVIKLFGREEHELRRFRAKNREVYDQQQAIFRRVSRYSPTLNLVSQLNVAILLAYGGSLVVRSTLSLGELIVFAGLLQQFGAQVSSMATIVNTLQQSLAGARRVFEVLDAPLEIETPKAPVELERVYGRVRFENVSFRYQPEQEALSGIDFEALPGQFIALLGTTGSGKSTLLSLIPRFYDPSAGRVLVDGHDARDFELDFLRRNVGVVFQDSLLFRDTVAENIAFGAPGASREQIETAARTAGAHDFIVALPDGYDTELEEGAANLSGGQRQRLALARAVILSPPILLLDDPTSAVDAATESEVLDALAAATRGRTTIMAANRVSALRRADLILVLHEGRIAERGTHAELVRERGIYFRAMSLQTADDETRRVLAGGEVRV
jgi:ABC-type multidrug transport system fused ATPase/permease subunit